MGSTVDQSKLRLPPGFRCHFTTVTGLRVVYAGLYDVNLDPPPKTVLDIGANAGAFSAWAMKKWPDAHIVAYEPSESTAAHLFYNLKPEDNHPRISIHVAALTSSEAEYVTLYDGQSNVGERSLICGPDQTPNCESVKSVHPKDVEPAEFIKIDCEGSELDILRHYKHLVSARAVVLEWHRPHDLPEMIDILARAGLRLFDQDRPERLLKFRRD